MKTIGLTLNAKSFQGHYKCHMQKQFEELRLLATGVCNENDHQNRTKLWKILDTFILTTKDTQRQQEEEFRGRMLLINQSSKELVKRIEVLLNKESKLRGS
jgi:hypothetical protein